MGGQGSGRLDKTQTALRAVTQKVTPITTAGTENSSLLLPNLSGVKDGLAKSSNKDIELAENQEIQLKSSQSGDYGELVRLQFMDTTNKEAKATIAFEDEAGDSKAWIVCHDYLSYPDNRHRHLSLEVSDDSGALQSRFTIPFDNDIAEMSINQANLTINRNSGETNGNLYFGGGGGGGKMGHAGSFSFYPEYATNSSYAFKIALEGASNDQLTLSAIGSTMLYVDDSMTINGTITQQAAASTNCTLQMRAPDNYDPIIEFYNSGTSTSCGQIQYDESAVDLILENKITGSNSDIIFKTGTTAEVLRCKGSGSIIITGVKSGASQVAAGAAAGEVWKTASHATLPDNVLMIGV